MQAHWLVLIELLVVMGAVLGFAIRELVLVRRSIRKDREAKAREAEQRPPA